MTDLARLAAKKYLSLSDIEESAYSEEAAHLIQSLPTTNARQVMFHLQTNTTTAPVCACGETLSWNGDARKYRRYCSKRCTAKYSTEEKKEKNLQTLGVEWHSQTAEWADKVKETSIKKFGADHYGKTREAIERRRAFFQANHGVDHQMDLPATRDKIKNTCLLKFGVENPAQAGSVKKKQTETIFDRYGVLHSNQRHYSPETFAILEDADTFAALIENEPILALCERLGVSTTAIYSRVKKLGLTVPRFRSSAFETSILQFISDRYRGQIICGDRKTIGDNYEIDILLPDLKVGIECNGSYWHSELNGRGKHYHLQKSQIAEAAGIRLIHIWEHDWNGNRSTVESFLQNILGGNRRVFARKCSVKRISNSKGTAFFNDHHYQKAVNASVTVGLHYDGRLVAAMSFGKSRYNKQYEWEMLRFATEKGTTVVGGGSRLFSAFVEANRPLSIVSYCDRSRSTGKLYHQLGFHLERTSTPNYYYTNNYTTFMSRQRFQKHKLKVILENFDPGKTEWENMIAHGYDRIWDCGQYVFVSVPTYE